MINRDVDLARRIGADGVHLSAKQLTTVASRPDLPLCAASCHTAAELRAAEALGADLAVLGPVCATATHPEAKPIGWEGFRTLCSWAAIPVFALGGMKRSDLSTAWSCGAHGIAMLRGAWESSGN